MLTGDVKYKTIDKTETLQFYEEYTFTNNYDYDRLIKADDKGNFIVHLVGKNGEPIRNHQVNFKINHQLSDKRRLFNISNSFEADKEGKIYVNNVDNYKGIIINSKCFEFNQKYIPRKEITILEN